MELQPPKPAAYALHQPAWLLCLPPALRRDLQSRLFRKSFGGVPPAKIHTNSFRISCRIPLTSTITDSALNSMGAELKRTVTFPLRMQSSIRLAFRSLEAGGVEEAQRLLTANDHVVSDRRSEHGQEL